jgi:hypothetical protein
MPPGVTFARWNTLRCSDAVVPIFRGLNHTLMPDTALLVRRAWTTAAIRSFFLCGTLEEHV